MKLSQKLAAASLASLLVAGDVWAQIPGNACPYPDGWRPPERELKRILANHQKWVEERWRPWMDKQRDLQPDLETLQPQPDPYRANFCKANLSKVDLEKAVLHAAILDDVDLTDAKLNGAQLTFADLNNASLRRAALVGESAIRAASACRSCLRDAGQCRPVIFNT